MGSLRRWGIVAAVAALLISNAVCLALLMSSRADRLEGPRVQHMALIQAPRSDGLQIKTIFSEDMVSPREVGAALPARLIAFEPDLRGVFAWEDSRTLLFKIETAPQVPSFKACVASQLTDGRGRALRGLTTFVLTAPRLDLVSVSQKGLDSDGYPIIELRFNDDMDPRALKKCARLRFADHRDGERDFTVLGAAPARSLRLVLSRAGAGALEVTLRAGLKSVNLPALAEDLVKVVAVEAKLALRYVAEHEMESGRFRVDLKFNGGVEREALAAAVEFEPKPEALTVLTFGDSAFEARFTPGKDYTMTIRKGLKSVEGLELQEDLSRRLTFPDLKSAISLSGEGFYLPSGAEPTICIRTCNATELTVEFRRLYANNVVPFVGRGMEWYPDRSITTAPPSRTIAINGRRNEWVETRIDLRSVFGAPPRGTYGVLASIKERSDDARYAVLQATDLGITVKEAPASFLVWVTSLETAAPVAGAKVTVLSETNQTVFEGVTDARGLVAFEGEVPNADEEPVCVVTAELGADLAFLDLTRTRAEEREKLPGGAPYPAKGYEAFVWTERGVYRPEEEVNAYAIVRDGRMRAPAAFPVRFRIIRPDGRTWQTLKGMLSEAATAHTVFTVPGYMPLGDYRIEVLGAADEVLGRRTLLLEEVRPDRIRVRVAVTPKRLAEGGAFRAEATAYHLFGQAAAGLSVKGILRLTTARFAPPGFENFRFAPQGGGRDVAERTIMLGEQVLDAEGKAAFEGVIPDAPLPFGRLMAHFSFTVSEKGGRSVTETVAHLVDAYETYLGIARLTPEPHLGGEARFEIVALKPDAEPASIENVVATVYRQEWVYGHEMVDGLWEWRARKVEHVEGVFEITPAAGRGEFVFTPRESGNYVVKAAGAQTLHQTGLKFSVSGSWWSPCAFMNPAAAEITADRAAFAPGEAATLNVLSPFAGTLLLSVETDRVRHAAVVPVVRGDNRVTVPVTDELWPNAYVVAQIVRPYWPPAEEWDLAGEEGAAEPVPAAAAGEGAPLKAVAPLQRPGDAAPPPRRPYRAFGVLPLRLDKARHAVGIELEAPAAVKPGEELVVRARTVDGEGAPLAAEVVLALVDEGLLSLTAEPYPDPLGWFARLRALACRTRDVYSYLVPNRPRAPGGDDEEPVAGLAKKRLNPIQYEVEKPVVRFYKPQSTNAAGELEVKLPAPDYAGRLRVLALAATSDKAGAAGAAVVVRADVVMRASYPRFLAPGDRAEVPIVFFNNREEAMKCAVEVLAKGPLAVEGAGEVELPAGKEAVLKLGLRAGESCGKAEIVVRARGEGFAKEEKIELPVRPAWASATLSASGIVPADGEARRVFETGAQGMPAFFEGTAEGTIVLSPSPMGEFVPAAKFLIAYPHGCAEQTTARLLALAAAGKLGLREAAENAVPLTAAGIKRLAGMQTPAGGFGMWPGSTEASPWVSVFAAHVLVTLRQEHALLLEDLLPDLLKYVEGLINDREGDMRTRAYACYVCAAAGRNVAPQALRLADEKIGGGAAQLLACALEMFGEGKAASALLARAPEEENGGEGFMSPVVVDAMQLLAAVRLGRIDDALPLVARLRAAARREGRWGNTHECAWALLALGTWAEAAGLAAEAVPQVELVAGNARLFAGELREPVELALAPGAAAEATCTARGAPAFFSLAVSGVPTTPVEEPVAGDFRITRQVRDFAGNPVEGPFVLGRAYVVALKFRSSYTLRNVIVTDLLPGGLEIENGRLASRLDRSSESEEGLRADHVEMRDDRLLLFLTVPPHKPKNPCEYCYVVRAIAAGEFVQPACTAECMYEPEDRAATEAGRVWVLAEQ